MGGAGCKTRTSHYSCFGGGATDEVYGVEGGSSMHARAVCLLAVIIGSRVAASPAAAAERWLLGAWRPWIWCIKKPAAILQQQCSNPVIHFTSFLASYKYRLASLFHTVLQY